MTDEAIVESQATPAPVVVADAPVTEPVAEPTPAKVIDPSKAMEAMQKRIDELTWRLNQRVDREPQANREEPPAKVEPAKPPKLEDFQFDEAKFQAAQTEYLRAETARLVAEGLSTARQQQEKQEQIATFDERQIAFAAKTPDYDEKVYAGIGGRPGIELPISDAMAEEIRSSELGAQIAYYLASNREVAMQLYQLPPRQVAREIGRIEARLATPIAPAAAAKPVPKVTQAPPPAPKIDTGDDTGVTITPDSAESDTAWSAEEWAKRRNKQIARRKS